MINGVEVYYYLIQIFLGIIAGVFSAIGIIRYKDEKKIFCKETYRNIRLEGIPKVYILIFLNIIIYLVLLYFIGISTTFLGNFNLIKYMLITPLLIITFVVDFKIREIPNRVTLFLFQLSLINILILGFVNVNLALDSIYGGLICGGIFLFLAIVGKLIYRKEAMGMGDVKLMGPLRSFIWLLYDIKYNIISIYTCSNNWSNSFNNKKE